MPERVYVLVHLNGSDQRYQRDTERKAPDGRWEAVPLFVIERREGVAMSEPAARALVAKIRERGWRGEVWLEDATSGRRIDIDEHVQPQAQDDRVPMHYRGLLVHPGRSVEHGHCWYVRFPGLAIDSVRGDTPEQAVDRVYERNLQSRAEHYESPEPAPQQTTAKGPRKRPGDL